MKIFVNMTSLAAGDHGFKKGDRVVCKVAKNEWYIGTVKRAGAKKIDVDFDDGYDAEIEAADFKHIKMLTTPKKLKRSLTDAEAKALSEVKKEVKPASKVEKEKPAPVKPTATVKTPLPIKKPAMVRPTATPAPDIKRPEKPAPIVKPVVKPAPAPTPAPTLVPEKKLEERKYKNDWQIILEGHGKTTWRFTVQDDPTAPLFKYRASSMAMSAQEALKRSLTELNGRASKFTIKYTAPSDTKTHTLENLTPDNAETELGALIKSLVPPPVLKPVPPPIKTPIHQPAPEIKRDDRPIVEKTAFQVYLIPDNDSTTGKWSYALKESPNAPRYFSNSQSIYKSPREALGDAINALPNNHVSSFTLIYVETLKGNAIDRKIVFENVGVERAYGIVDRLMQQDTQGDSWFLHVMNDGAKSGQNNWRWQVNNYEAQMRYRPGFKKPAIEIDKQSEGHYPSALEAYFAAVKHVSAKTFTLQIWNGVHGNYTNSFPNVDKLQAVKHIEELFDKPAIVLQTPDGPAADAPYLRCANDGLFDMAAKGSDNDKMRYMRDVWHRANEIIFGHRLQFPSILRFLKEQKTQSFRRRGHWRGGHIRELAMSRRVFNAGQEKFLEIFVHEMCHQAVSEIDRVVDINKGHGPYWKAWMVKSGIPPSRYDETDTQEYMDDAEKEKHQEKLDALQRAAEEKKNLRPISNNAPLGTPAQFFWSDKNAWIQGVVIGIFSGKLIFMNNKDTGAYVMLPNKGVDRLYEIPSGSESDDYMASAWQRAATGVKDYLTRQQVLKQAKKGNVRGLLGQDIRNLLGY